MWHEKHRPAVPSELVMSGIKQEEFNKLMFATNNSPAPRILVVHGRCGTGKRTAIETLLMSNPRVVATGAAATTTAPLYDRSYYITFVDCIEHTTDELVQKINTHIRSYCDGGSTGNNGGDGGWCTMSTQSSSSKAQADAAKKKSSGISVLILRNPPSVGDRSGMKGYLVPFRDALNRLAQMASPRFAFPVAASSSWQNNQVNQFANLSVSSSPFPSQQQQQQPQQQQQQQAAVTIFLLTDHDMHSTKFDLLVRLPTAVHSLATFFHVPPVTEIALKKRLTAILDKEKLTSRITDKNALATIAQSAEGDIRHALLQLEWYVLPIQTEMKKRQAEIEALVMSPAPSSKAKKSNNNNNAKASSAVSNNNPLTSAILGVAAATTKKKGLTNSNSNNNCKSVFDDDFFNTPPPPIIVADDDDDDDDAARKSGKKSGRKSKQEDEKSPSFSNKDKKSKKEKQSSGGDSSSKKKHKSSRRQREEETIEDVTDDEDDPCVQFMSSNNKNENAATNAVSFGAKAKPASSLSSSGSAAAAALPVKPFNSADPVAVAASSQIGGVKKNGVSNSSVEVRTKVDGHTISFINTNSCPSGTDISVRDEITSAAHTVGRLLCNKKTAEYALARCTAAPRKLMGYLFENAFGYFDSDNISDLSKATTALSAAEVQMAERFFDGGHFVTSATNARDVTGSTGNSEGERALIVFHRQYAQLKITIPRSGGLSQVKPESFLQPPASWREGLPPAPTETHFQSDSLEWKLRQAQTAPYSSFDPDDNSADLEDDAFGTGPFSSNSGNGGNNNAHLLRRVDTLQRLSGLSALTHVLQRGNVIQHAPSDYRAAVLDIGPMASKILFENPLLAPAPSSSLSLSAPSLHSAQVSPTPTQQPPLTQQQHHHQHKQQRPTQTQTLTNKNAPKRTLFTQKLKQDAEALAAKVAAEDAKRKVLSHAAVKVLQTSFLPPKIRYAVRVRGDYTVVPTLASEDGEVFLGGAAIGMGRVDPTILDPIEDDDD